jgi:peptidyl-prolyl cis-trans isomerase C
MKSTLIAPLCAAAALAAGGFAWSLTGGRPAAEPTSAEAGAPPEGRATPAPVSAAAFDQAEAPGGQAPAAAPVPAELPEVVARVNGEEIARTEFNKAVQNLEARVGSPVPADQRNQIFRDVLDQLIGYRLLVQESRTRKVQVTDADLESRLAEIRSQFADEAAFRSALGSQAKTLDDLKRETREGMVIEKMLRDELEPQVQVTDADIQGFYAQNQERFQQPQSVRASHILIPVEPSATDDARAQAKTKVDGLLAQIKGGADFAEMAREHSSDGSAAQGGDLGYFSKGQMVPEFEQAAFALEAGQVSEVVQTQFGYHIIKAVEHRAPRTVPLSEVSERITAFLTQQRQQQLTGAFVTSLRAKGKVEVLM